MLILMGAGFLSLAMGFTGIPRALAESIGVWNLSPIALIAILTLFYIILGCFLDGLSSIVLTMAVIEPMVRAAGFDMLWFGVYLMIVVEMAQNPRISWMHKQPLTTGQIKQSSPSIIVDVPS